jgi:hypothetical protein
MNSATKHVDFFFEQEAVRYFADGLPTIEEVAQLLFCGTCDGSLW